GLAERAYAAGEIDFGDAAHDDLPFDLLDALLVESDPRAQRLFELVRERGWARWTRLDRLERPAGPPTRPPWGSRLGASVGRPAPGRRASAGRACGCGRRCDPRPATGRSMSSGSVAGTRRARRLPAGRHRTGRRWRRTSAARCRRGPGRPGRR